MRLRLLTLDNRRATLSDMKIIDYRKKHGLTQADFAGLLTDSGYPATQALVSKWEQGDTELTGERCAEIERVTRGQVKRKTLRPEIFGKLT